MPVGENVKIPTEMDYRIPPPPMVDSVWWTAMAEITVVSPEVTVVSPSVRSARNA